MVRKHLLTGTLDDFDSNYYISLAQRQQNDARVRFTGLEDRDISERAGLGLIGSQSVVADSNQLINLQKRQSRRQRRFLTDINANLDVAQLNEVERKLGGLPADVAALIPKQFTFKEFKIPLSDLGFQVSALNGNTFNLTIGDGDGYYIPSKLSNNTEIPLFLNTDIENTFYVPDSTRRTALELFKESSEYTLQVSAATDKNEFVAGDTGVTSLIPLYLTLDLSSVEFEPNSNPLTSRYKGRYEVESNQTLIDQHSKNNGFAVTRVNIDYRDPIYRYILDGGKVELSLNDVNFSSILDPEDYPGGVRISRNIPFGLVVTPVRGSKFNPFNGQSSLASFEEDHVRTLRLSSDIDISDSDPNKTALEEVNLFNDTGGDLRVGIGEPVDSQNVIYKYSATDPRFTNTFFKNGEYSTSADITPVSSQGLSFMVKDVIDYIVDNHSSSSILWYDVIRRMPLNEVGHFIYDSDPRFIGKLEQGFRSNLKIKFLLNTNKDVSDKLLPDDDKTIIKTGDR